MNHYNFVGVDIAKEKFDCALKKNDRFIEDQFKNTAAGYKQFLVWLKKHTVNAFVCMESTGPYSVNLAEFLLAHQIIVSVENPMRIKNHSKSLLLRNKNDIVDARLICSYAETFIPRQYVAISKDQKTVKEANQLIDTLSEQKLQLENQLDSIRTTEIRKELEKSIKSIDKRIDAVEKKLKLNVKNNAEYSVTKDRLLTVKGIGEKTAHRIIGYLPDISQFKNAKQLAAFAGLSPSQNQSGKFFGKTKISKCGDAKLRKALYMPALVAKNSNPHFKNFCERLAKNGLKPKQIICAVMRKLLHVIFGMLKHKQDFNPALV